MQHLQRQTTSTNVPTFAAGACACAGSHFPTFVDLCPKCGPDFPHPHFPTFVAPPGAADPQMFPHLQQASSTSEINKCGAPGPQFCTSLHARGDGNERRAPREASGGPERGTSAICAPARGQGAMDGWRDARGAACAAHTFRPLAPAAALQLQLFAFCTLVKTCHACSGSG
jgi:hypothetical protein